MGNICNNNFNKKKEVYIIVPSNLKIDTNLLSQISDSKKIIYGFKKCNTIDISEDDYSYFDKDTEYNISILLNNKILYLKANSDRSLQFCDLINNNKFFIWKFDYIKNNTYKILNCGFNFNYVIDIPEHDYSLNNELKVYPSKNCEAENQEFSFLPLLDNTYTMLSNIYDHYIGINENNQMIITNNKQMILTINKL